MVKYVIVNGLPTAGKDLFASFCVKKLEERGKNATMISSVDFVKEVARFCGWNGEKTPENRKFLSDVKDLLTTWGDVPFRKVIDAAEDFDGVCRMMGSIEDSWVFVMMREPTEIGRFVALTGAATVFIDRKAAEGTQSNHADAQVKDYNYDWYIDNNSTIEQLDVTAEELVNHLLKSE